MRKSLLVASSFVFVMLFTAGGARAQTAKVAPDPAVLRDPLLEKDSKGNLEKARHYFKLKKAYRASLSRAEEIIAGYPNFSQIDEALYIAGMSNLHLARKEGKQPATLAPEKHLEEARIYLSRLVSDHPESKFRGDAERELATIGGVKQKKEND